MVFLLQALFGRGPLRSFRSGDYSFFWASSVFAIVSHMMLMLFRAWVALELTDSPEIVALAATAGELPSLILSLPGGVLADRFNRKGILIISEVVTILALLGFVALLATDQMEVWSLFVLSAITGVAFAVAIPSRMAVVPNLVSRENMANGIALSSIMFSGGMFVGSLIGGRLFDEFGGAAAFGVAAGLSVLSIVFILPVNTRQGMREGTKSMRSVWMDTVEGHRSSGDTRPSSDSWRLRARRLSSDRRTRRSWLSLRGMSCIKGRRRQGISARQPERAP